MTELKGVKWMESEIWKNSQAKPQPRKAKVTGIQGVKYIDNEKVVTNVKMRFE